MLQAIALNGSRGLLVEHSQSRAAKETKLEAGTLKLVSELLLLSPMMLQ